MAAIEVNWLKINTRHMKKYILATLLLSIQFGLFAQEFPVIKNHGGIYDIPEATVKPDPARQYKIIVDLVSADDDPAKLAWSLNNVARMINLHTIAGVPPANIHVVLAVHGGMTTSLLNESAYQSRFQVENPHIDLYKALHDAGVRIIVCGQSMKARSVDPDDLLEHVEIATSMLTTVSTFQQDGYVVFKF